MTELLCGTKNRAETLKEQGFKAMPPKEVIAYMTQHHEIIAYGK